MSQIERRLNRLARRVAEQAEYIQYFTSPASPLLEENAQASAWLDPVTLPPSDEISRRLRSIGGREARSAPEDSESEGSRRTPVLLATHFLEDWYEWQILSYRWAEFLGSDEKRDVLPRSAALVEDTEDQVDTLVAEEGFLEAFRTSRSEKGIRRFEISLRENLRTLVSDEPEADSPDPREFISSVTRFGEYDRLVRGLARRTESRFEQMPEPIRDCLLSLQRAQEGLIGPVQDLMERNDTAASQLRAYRFSSLSLSWLITRSENALPDVFGGDLPFMARLYRRVDKTSREEIASEQSEADRVQKLIGRIVRTVEEIGVGRFAQSVEGHGFRRGESTPFTGQSARILTSHGEADPGEDLNSDVCVGIAISDYFYPGPPPPGNTNKEKGRGNRLERRFSDLDQVLKRMKQWMARYGPDGKTVMIITDLWAPEVFADHHAQIFEAWGSRGANVFVAVPNHRGTSLSIVDSDF